MDFCFYKFDGAGNDFVIVDNRRLNHRFSVDEVARICHRRFGVGADGLMTIDAASDGYDFEMRYYNSDGRIGSMCGNGGRCIAACAHMLGMSKQLNFKGFDGPHDAEILDWDQHRGMVRLSMRDIAADGIRECLDGWFIDTGSPHYVQQVVDLKHFDVVGEGRRLRHCKEQFPEGTNVDFIETLPDGRLAVRTFERGVEDETWACGTGATACAIVTGNHDIVMPGGSFRVDFERADDAIRKVFLTGPVSLNFIGTWTSSAV